MSSNILFMRVQAIKIAIENGEYTINNEQVAEKLIQFEYALSE